MANIINGDNGAVSGSAGLKSSADSTGVLALQTNGTTAVSISTGQVVTLAQPLPVASGGTNATSASAARTSLGLVIGTDVLAPSGSAASLTSFPTLNQNTTGSAATVTGNATGSTFGFNSGYGSVATAYGCRAWINFNGTGTPAIRGSGNVTNITDNGTGNYTVNFTTSMPDTGYSAVGTCGSPSVAHGIFMFVAGTGTITGTGGVQFATTTVGAAQYDFVFVCLSVFR
jgi:hypothetical protein